MRVSLEIHLGERRFVKEKNCREKFFLASLKTFIGVPLSNVKNCGSAVVNELS